MKKFILLTAFINLIFLSACSSETAKSNVGNENAPNASNANVETVQETNANLVPANFGRNITNQPIDSNVKANANQTVKTQLNGAPAPFDSTVTTTMNKEGKFLETRAFKKDPTIIKVERLQELKKVLVYLKNGKVVEMPFDKASIVFINGSPADILTAAGIKPPATPPNTNPGKVEEAKKDAIIKIQ